MRKYVLSLGLVALAGLSLIGCSTSNNPVGPMENTAQPIPIFNAYEWSGDGIPCGETLTVNLIAGQHYNIGTAVITLEDGTLCVEINTADNWVMTETHVAIGPELDSLPQTGSGNPQVGKFYFGTDHDPAVTTFTYCCNPLEFIWEEGEIYIAIHAAVELLDENGNSIQEETAWAEGPEFPGRSWATYVAYIVQSCSDEEECELTVTYPNGGEDYCVDDLVLITWDFLGESPGYVRIELLLDDVSCMTIADSVSNSGSYEWVAQQCDGVPEAYKVRVTELGCGAVDESDGPFLINACGGEE